MHWGPAISLLQPPVAGRGILTPGKVPSLSTWLCRSSKQWVRAPQLQCVLTLCAYTQAVSAYRVSKVLNAPFTLNADKSDITYKTLACFPSVDPLELS